LRAARLWSSLRLLTAWSAHSTINSRNGPWRPSSAGALLSASRVRTLLSALPRASGIGLFYGSPSMMRTVDCSALALARCVPQFATHCAATSLFISGASIDPAAHARSDR